MRTEKLISRSCKSNRFAFDFFLAIYDYRQGFFQDQLKRTRRMTNSAKTVANLDRYLK